MADTRIHPLSFDSRIPHTTFTPTIHQGGPLIKTEDGWKQIIRPEKVTHNEVQSGIMKSLSLI